jgi:hypothetical protein
VTKPPRKDSRRTVVRRILDRAPNGGLSIEDLARAVRAELGERWYREKAWEDFKRGVASDARVKTGDGLPYAAEINGQYLRRSAWKPKDYEYAMRKLVTNSHAMKRRASQLGDECELRYGVVIDLNAIIEEIDFAAIADEACDEIIEARDAKESAVAT